MNYSQEELEYHCREVIFAAVHIFRLNIHPFKVGHMTGPTVGGVQADTMLKYVCAFRLSPVTPGESTPFAPFTG